MFIKKNLREQLYSWDIEFDFCDKDGKSYETIILPIINIIGEIIKNTEK